MTAFVTPTPLRVVSPLRATQVSRIGRGTQRYFIRRNKVTNATTVRASSEEEGAGNSRNDANSSASSARDQVASWQEELSMLLDPKMPAGVKQVLIQDIAKRAPEVLNESFFNKSCKELGLEGVTDVIRQFQEDLLPDLVSNGAKYVSKVAEDLPSKISKMSADAENMRAGMPTSINPEEIQREFRNIFNRTPEGLFTPDYKVLAKFDEYEIRQYPSLIIAETSMVAPDLTTSTSRGPTEMENVSVMGESFNNLAGFLFGKNDSSKAMKMTTPVILSKGIPQETMSFIIGEYERVEEVPKSLDESVVLREQPGQVFAVLEFPGFVTQGEAKRQREKLLSMLSRDAVQLSPEAENSYKCMIYNGPSTLPNLRRNDMMIEVVYCAEGAKEAS